MPEAVAAPAEQTPEVVIPASPYSEESWKTTPSSKVEVSADPAIKEKDEKIIEEKPTVVKTDEPDKIPGATPKPIQDKPEVVKEDEPKKEAVAAPEPLKFANEDSEKVFNLLKEGKTDDVLSILSEQKKLSQVDKMNPADVIKLNLQYQNKDFSPEDINELFSERYPLPEKPEQSVDETDEDFATRTAKYSQEVQKVENRIKRDAKPATTELLKLQKEIVLPDIPKETPAPVGLSQEELDKIKQSRENYLKSVEGGVDSFNGFGATYKDKEVEIPVVYAITPEQKAEMKPLLENFNMDAYFEKRWIAEDGSFNTKQLAEDLHLLENRDAIFQKLVSEVGNKRHEASIKSIKNIDYSGATASNGDTGETPQQKEGKMVNHFFSA